jgi:hypothetical protein
MRSALPASILLCLLFITAVLCAELRLDTFESNPNETNFWIFGTITLDPEAGEVMAQGDTLKFALETPSDCKKLPKFDRMFASFYDSVYGTKMATLEVLEADIKNGSMPKGAQIVLDKTPKGQVKRIDFTMLISFTKGDWSGLIKNDQIISVLEYSFGGDGQPDEKKFTAEYGYKFRQPLAVLTHMNATCAEKRSECVVLPYVVGITGLSHNVDEITYAIGGALSFEPGEKLNCWVNNTPATATFSRDNGRDSYTVKHSFEKGYDYAIRCPSSALVNGFDQQEDSVLLLTAKSIAKSPQEEDILFSQTYPFPVGYDQSNVIIYSNSKPVGKYNDQVYTVRFPFSQLRLRDKTVINKMSAKVDFSGSNPDFFKWFLTDETNKMIQQGTIHPVEPKEHGARHQFPFFDVNLGGKTAYNMTISARFEKTPTFDAKNLKNIQTRFELQYTSIPFGDDDEHTAKLVSVHGIADSPILDAISGSKQLKTDQIGLFDTRKGIEKSLQTQFSIPLNEKIFAAYVKHSVKLDIIFTLPASRSRFYLPEGVENFTCRLGSQNIVAKINSDDYGRSLALEFKNILLAHAPVALRCTDIGNGALEFVTTSVSKTFYDTLNVLIQPSPDQVNDSLEGELFLQLNGEGLDLQANDDDVVKKYTQNYLVRFSKESLYSWQNATKGLILASSLFLLFFSVFFCLCKGKCTHERKRVHRHNNDGLLLNSNSDSKYVQIS